MHKDRSLYNLVFFKIGFCLKITLLIFVISGLNLLLAEAKAERNKNPRSPNTRALIDNSDSYDYSASDALGGIIENSANTDLYDPITLGELRILKERAQPSTSKDDIDPDEIRYIGEKALAIQSSTTLLPLIRNSEIGFALSSLESGYLYISQFFRVKLNHTGERLIISREDDSLTLIELNIKMSISNGLDPQLRLSENIRMRYDWKKAIGFIEYAEDF